MPTEQSSILIPQDYTTAADRAGKRERVLPQQIPSGTFFGQYQLRGSILVLKDAQDAASGYIAFGTDITTIPTSPTDGTGVYQDYRGIFGNNGGVPQFYLDASDGKAYAGGGKVKLDVNGIILPNDGSAGLGFTNGGTYKTAIYADDGVGGAGYQGLYIENNLNADEDDSAIFLQTLNGSSKRLSFTLFAEDGVGSYAGLYDSNNSFQGLLIGKTILPGGTPAAPLSLLHLASTAPTFRMDDTTGSAKSLLVTVDANLAKLEEAGGAANNLLVLDLANGRVGIGTSSPASGYALDVSGNNVRVNVASSGNYGFVARVTGASASGSGPQNAFMANDGSAMESQHRIGAFLFGGYDGSAEVTGAAMFAQTDETWSTSARGSKIRFYTTPNGTTSLTEAMRIEQNQKVYFASEIEIDGALNHDGTTIGFYGVTPVTRPSAYTQTYSTANKTLDADSITDPAAYGAGANGYSTGAMAAAVHAAVIALHAQLNDCKQMLNAVIDDLQSQGILQ